ncbi:hypothetical protein PMZ80_007613 [Knufia obscura]|uniref:Uncharacterized protein n=2 Tax=Knufia TaxID=430999 RepID=A0AAN8I868_9EURO|nr:hypothetical protein PMZ80_007613 [Knufia obscura]KAK5954156.1 hypothetical protein OHC33_004728 [Knufia fluminis]
MAVEVKPIHELLSTITDAFTAAKDAFPEDTASFVPPTDGISLLDVKNDLLLSYLQHLVFLILLRLKNGSGSAASQANLGNNVIKKLIELRAYFDRGVRPLEGRLRYQIDKVLRAAEDAGRSAASKAQVNGASKKAKKISRRTDNDSDVSASDSDAEEDSDASEAEDSDDENALRPNISALASGPLANSAAKNARDRQSGTRDGIYKPPRLNPTAMPNTSTRSREEAEDTRAARRRKNALLDEYINEEHSSAPAAQPSIGSNNTILDRGRQHSSLNTRDRDRERERRQYEESNFTRLPGASKAEKRKDKARQMREGRDMFGGEDWTGLGGFGDRVSRTVAGGREKGSVLDRREKRKRDTTDMPRGDGVGIGESFEKRRRVVQGRDQRKRGGRR